MTQKEFAEFLGINFDAYQSKELGRLKLNHDEIQQLVQAAGVHPHSLNPDVSPVACTFRQPVRVYTSEHWQEWRKTGAPAKRTAEGAQKQVSSWTDVLLVAAGRVGDLDQVMLAVANALSRIRRDFGLEAETNRVLQSRKVRETYRLKLKTLRADSELARRFKVSAKQLRAGFDDDEIQVERDLVLPWAPESFTAPPSKQSSNRRPAV